MAYSATNLVRVGDAAVTLLKAGADSTKRDGEGLLAIDLAPDKEVRLQVVWSGRYPSN